MNIKPMVDRVLVRREEVAKSKGGVVLPDSVQSSELVYGYVLALGLPRKDYVGAETIKIGDKVVFTKYSAANITDGIDNYLIIRYDDIMATINSDVKEG